MFITSFAEEKKPRSREAFFDRLYKGKTRREAQVEDPASPDDGNELPLDYDADYEYGFTFGRQFGDASEVKSHHTPLGKMEDRRSAAEHCS